MAAKKHGVEIIPHKNWNTKKIWNRGYLMATYGKQPKKLHFRSPMVNDKNQDLCGGWFIHGDIKEGETVNDVLMRRVIAGKKPMAILHFFPEERELAELNETELMDEGLAADLVKKSNGWNVVVAQHGILRDLFDLDALARDYVENGIYTAEEMAEEIELYGSHDLIDFSEGWDVEDVPPWVTGLILGYPIENTISIYNDAVR